MQKVTEQKSIETVNLVTKTLLELGFDMQLLGNERYVRPKLEISSVEQVSQLKEAFIRNKHPPVQ
jgi:hypothetical protein